MPKRSEMTAYGRAQVDKRNASKRKKNTGNRATANIVGTCGAKKKTGGRCRQPAGFGTTHKGLGACKFHGGAAPTHQSSAIRQEAVLMGAPVDINPVDAMIWCIKLAAGEVQFFIDQLASLAKADWYEETIVGKQLHVLAKEKAKAEDRLFKYSKDAIALGLAERAVRLAEQYGTTIARFIKGVLGDLELTPEQVAMAPGIVRRHLILLQGSSPITDEDRRQPLAAIPQRVREPVEV